MSEQNDNSSNAKGDNLLTMNQALEILKVSRPTMYRMLEQGKLKGKKVGNQWRFSQRDINGYINRGPVAVAFSNVSAKDTIKEINYFQDQLKLKGKDINITLSEIEDQGSLIESLAESLIFFSIASRASNIHLEAFNENRENCYILRLRIDGVLQEIRRIPYAVGEGIMIYLKSWMKMDLESHLPQDGRIKLRLDNRNFTFNFSITPSVYGFSAVAGILDPDNIILGMEHLGLSSGDIERLRNWIKRSHGIIIVTGASGTGRTTLAYSLLHELSGRHIKTVTIEDPVEVVMPWVTQFQLKHQIGLNYPGALRTVMRQDPDIIMVADIKDRDTLDLAIHAALSGHLLILVFNTPDAVSALLKLGEMGIEPYMISSVLIGIAATRLARKICKKCREPEQEGIKQISKLIKMLEIEVPGEKIRSFRGRGCDNCYNSGYSGRTGLFELLEQTGEIFSRFPVHEVHNYNQLYEAVKGKGFTSFISDGLQKIMDGVISLEELNRVMSFRV